MTSSMKTKLSTMLNSSSTLGSSFLSLKEYMDSAIQKLERIASGKTDIKTVVLPLQVEINGARQNIAAAIYSDDLKKAIDGTIDTVTVYANDQLEPYTVTADEVTEAFHDNVGDLQVQGAFLDACMSDREVTVESFSSSCLNKFTAVTRSKVEQYASLFSVGDKVDALKSWIAQVKTNEIVQTSSYIELVDRDKYTGVSVWSVVVDDFVSTITMFFDKVWQGIQDIKGFFQRLWDGIIKLGKYLISKAFRYLTSNLEKSGSKIGIFDYPIIQLQIGTWSKVAGNPNEIAVSVDSQILESMGQISRAYGYAYYTAYHDKHYSNVTNVPDFIRNVFKTCCVTHVTDPESGLEVEAIVKPCDVAIPNNSRALIDGFVIRLGPTASGAIILSIYPQVNQGLLDAYDDSTIYSNIRSAFSSVVSDLSSETGLAFPVQTTYRLSDGSPTDKMLDSDYLLPHIMDVTSDAGENEPVDFASHFKIGSNNDLPLSSDDIIFSNVPYYTIHWGDAIIWLLMKGFFSYFALMSPAAESSFFVNNSNPLSPMLSAQSIAYFERRDGDTPGVEFDNSLPSDWFTCYKPYLSYNLTPASIHLQTLSERAKEIEWTILAAVIAAAAAFATYKMIRYRKNLRIDTEIARGQCDNFAWSKDFSQPGVRDQYIKLRKVARKKERLSALFGLTSKAAAEAASYSFNDANSDANINNSTTLIDLIKG